MAKVISEQNVDGMTISSKVLEEKNDLKIGLFIRGEMGFGTHSTYPCGKEQGNLFGTEYNECVQTNI